MTHHCHAVLPSDIYKQVCHPGSWWFLLRLGSTQARPLYQSPSVPLRRRDGGRRAKSPIAPTLRECSSRGTHWSLAAPHQTGSLLEQQLSARITRGRLAGREHSKSQTGSVAWQCMEGSRGERAEGKLSEQGRDAGIRKRQCTVLAWW